MSMEQFQSRSPDEIVEWARVHARLPVVIKPTRSAGVKGVKICRTLAQVEEAARNVQADQVLVRRGAGRDPGAVEHSFFSDPEALAA